MALKIRRDDMVKVITGKDRGKTGRVLRVDAAKDRVFVEGMNIQKRHASRARCTTPSAASRPAASSSARARSTSRT